MLDLVNLEIKLDLALANETSESLTAWLHEKRLNAFFQSLGEGIFTPIPDLYIESVLSYQNVVFETKFNEVPCSQHYQLAS
ncbi:MAG: hypothetical protein KGQ50_10190 [Bacteroidetes bacterium]|nr:hypothetical protein [Bacteroidota bacterium]